MSPSVAHTSLGQSLGGRQRCGLQQVLAGHNLVNETGLEGMIDAPLGSIDYKLQRGLDAQ
jgi:hypothetical protein